MKLQRNFGARRLSEFAFFFAILGLVFNVGYPELKPYYVDVACTSLAAVLGIACALTYQE